MNKFSISGKVFMDPVLRANGTVSIHFLVRNSHNGKFYEHPVSVKWSSLFDSDMIKIKEGQFVEIEGHIQTLGRQKGAGKFVQNTLHFADRIRVVDSLPEWQIASDGMVVVGMYETFKRDVKNPRQYPPVNTE